MERLYSISEVATILGLNRGTVWYRIKKGQLAADVLCGGLRNEYRIRESVLQDYLKPKAS